MKISPNYTRSCPIWKMYQSKIGRFWIELFFFPLKISQSASISSCYRTSIQVWLLLSTPVLAWFAGQPPAVYRPCSWTQDADSHAISLLNLIMYNVTMTTSTNALLLHKCFLVLDDLRFCKCIMFLFLHAGEKIHFICSVLVQLLIYLITLLS